MALCMEDESSRRQQGSLEFFSKNKKNAFMDVCINEVETLKSVTIQFGLLVRFYMIRDEEVQQMEHYFDRMRPIILNENNIGTLNILLNQFIDEGGKVR